MHRSCGIWVSWRDAKHAIMRLHYYANQHGDGSAFPSVCLRPRCLSLSLPPSFPLFFPHPRGFIDRRTIDCLAFDHPSAPSMSIYIYIYRFPMCFYLISIDFVQKNRFLLCAFSSIHILSHRHFFIAFISSGDRFRKNRFQIGANANVILLRRLVIHINWWFLRFLINFRTRRKITVSINPSRINRHDPAFNSVRISCRFLVTLFFSFRWISYDDFDKKDLEIEKNVSFDTRFERKREKEIDRDK